MITTRHIHTSVHQIVRILTLVFVLTMLPILAAYSLPSDSYTTSSMLSSGKWVKIKIYDSGIHQLPHAQLKSWGFSDPAKVKVYGYGGAGLSEKFDDSYVDDLPQVPIVRQDDRILFYAQGVMSWEYASSTYKHTRNPYSAVGYYFLTENDEDDLLITEEDATQPTGKETVVDTYDEYALHESELINVGHLGRNLYGEDFLYTTLRTFSFYIPGIQDSSTATVEVSFVAKTSTKTTLGVTVNNQYVSTSTSTISASTQYYEQIKSLVMNKAWTSSESEPNIDVMVEFPSGSHTTARLDYIKLVIPRKLQLYDGIVRFRDNLDQSQAIAYQLDCGTESDLLLWDVSDASEPIAIHLSVDDSQASFVTSSATMGEYIAATTTYNFETPEWVEEVASQNLHGLAQCDMVIISPSAFTTQAQLLADHHASYDGLTVEVVAPQLIYNEFSSGAPDATAYRRLMKMFYDRADDMGTPPRYLLLFGDGIYDNRLLDSDIASLDYPFLLCFTQEDGYDDRYSYITDDYFGMLEDGVGSSSGDDIQRVKMQLGVGRLPVRTTTEATTVVDKIIAYATDGDYGNWKNNLCFLADDGSADDGYSTSYMEQAEEFSQMVDESFVSYKILLDAYTQEYTSVGATYPDARTLFYEVLDKGTLMVNYVGHGSTVSLTDNNMLTYNDIQSNMYLTHLPLWVTATCDFSRFDELSYTGGEELLLNAKGGAIGLFSTTRPVFTDKNRQLNESFIQSLFSKDDNDEWYTLGDIMRLSKDAYIDSYGSSDPGNNHLNFILLGDPALTLGYPEYEAHVTTINDVTIGDEAVDTLKALSFVTMEGEIRTPLGEIDTDFNGYVYPRVYDSKVEATTLDNNDIGTVVTYEDRTNLLYEGRDTVANGYFKFSFNMPMEINFSDEEGLVNLYAYDDRGHEAQGYNTSFLVGDIDDTVELEGEGPIIHSIYLNSSSFKNGDTVNETPVFMAEVEDASGINVSSTGVGQDIIIDVDDNVFGTRYTLNNYFTFDVGSYSKGTVMYELPILDDGEHTIRFKVWDTQNNSSEETINFTVQTGLEPTVDGLYVTVNPASDYTQFLLTHDRPNGLVKIQLQVYNLMGQLMWYHIEEGLSDYYTSYPITWDLTDMSGRKLPAGLYLYKASVSFDGGSEATQAQKLIIKGQ